MSLVVPASSLSSDDVIWLKSPEVAMAQWAATDPAISLPLPPPPPIPEVVAFVVAVVVVECEEEVREGEP